MGFANWAHDVMLRVAFISLTILCFMSYCEQYNAGISIQVGLVVCASHSPKPPKASKSPRLFSPASDSYPPPPPPPAPLPPPPPHPLANNKPLKPGQIPPPASVDTHASFSLYYGRNFKVVQNFFNNYTYLLLQDQQESFGRDWDMNMSAFIVPLLNYTMASSSAVGFLEMLGCLGKLRAVPTSFAVASPCVAQLMWQGQIPTVDSANLTDTTNSTSSDNSTMMPIFFDALFSSPNAQTYAVDLVQNNSISFDAVRDRGPLQRAEWIKFIAAFFDLESAANSIFAQIESNYQCLNGSVKASANSSTPMVAWLSYNMDLGLWTFSKDPYKMQLIMDASGMNLNESILSMSFNMSNQSDMDSLYNVFSTLDVVIDDTQVIDPSSYTLDNFTMLANVNDTSAYPFLANKRVWRYDKRVGANNSLDWFEGAIVQPQVVLRDIIEALHPNTLSEGYNPTFLRNIATGESIVNTTYLSCQHDITLNTQPTIIPCNTNKSSKIK